MHDAEVGLWLLIARLRAAGRPLGRTTLIPYAEIKLPDVPREYDALVSQLLAARLIDGDAEAFTLTRAGEAQLAGVSAHHSLTARFYDAYYRAAAASPSHAGFCRRVYGCDLSQHGAADMTQLQIALDSLAVRPGMTLLDFGCGDGRIAEHVSDATGAVVSGIDIAGRAIQQGCERTRGKADRLRFYVGDFAAGDLSHGAGELPAGPFEGILALDSFFLVPDQPALLDVFLRLIAPGGCMAIFYLCQQLIDAGQTPLGRALAERGITYRAVDLSAENTRHWQLKKQVLLELEPQFRAEDAAQPGALFLWRNRTAECDGTMERVSRYLYIVAR